MVLKGREYESSNTSHSSFPILSYSGAFDDSNETEGETSEQIGLPSMLLMCFIKK